MEDRIYDCVKIAVDCTPNDPKDIELGGAEIIGFDFFVKEEDAKDIIKFILVALQRLEVPLMNIGVVEKLQLREHNICPREKILESINGQAQLIKEEAKKNYGINHC